MKISFKNDLITIDGVEVGHLSPSSQGCYVIIGERSTGKTIGRFGKYKGMAGGAAEAKRWLKPALNKAGSADALVTALEPQDVSPIDYQMMPLPRRGKKTERESARLLAWACREMVGKEVHFIHGDTYVCEHSTNGFLKEIRQDGYHLIVDGEEMIFSTQTVQSIWDWSK